MKKIATIIAAVAALAGIATLVGWKINQED